MHIKRNGHRRGRGMEGRAQEGLASDCCSDRLSSVLGGQEHADVTFLEGGRLTDFSSGSFCLLSKIEFKALN